MGPAFHPGLVPSGCYDFLFLRSKAGPRLLDTLLSLLETLSSSLPDAQHSLSPWLIHDAHRVTDYTWHLMWNSFFDSPSPGNEDRTPEVGLKGEETSARRIPVEAPSQFTACLLVRLLVHLLALRRRCDNPAHRVPGA